MSLQTRISDLITAIGTDVKQFRTWITGSATGDLSGLDTSATNLVDAINEVYAASPADASETVKGVVELATLAEVATGTDAVRAVTPAGVRQERLALKTEILGGASAAYDTLQELAAALADDDTDIAAIYTALANRVRVDTAAQGLTAPQQSNARTNIGAIAAAAIGDPDADLVALYTTAKS